MTNPIIFDWGQAPTLAPSIRRASPLAWIAASAIAGTSLASLALALVWRPILGLPEPPGSLFEHFGYAAKLLVHMGFDRFFSGDARLYLAWLSKRSDAERVALIWRGALGLWCFVAPWAVLAKTFLRSRDGLIHLRGSTRKAGPEAVAELNRKLAARVVRRPDHEIAPSVPYPADLWTRHVLVVGGVGSGKSTALRPLIDKVVRAGEQMLLFDPKSEFTSGFGIPELIAPWDSRGLAWDIARDMRNLLDMRRFAAAMIKESHDPMWSNASRQLLVGLMIYLKGTRELDWGWRELSDLIALPQAGLLQIMKRWHPEAERSVEKTSVTSAGILINLASFCSSIFDLAEAWGDHPPERRVSFVEWILGNSPHRQLILQGHGAYEELTKSYVQGIFEAVSAMVNSVEMTDDPDRKIWFIADEFAMMGKIPVRPLFAVGRSRGIRCVVACQDFAQLEEIHGAQFVRALVGMCGTLLVGQVMQGETAEQLCKAFGAREVERVNVSSSSGSRGSSTLSYNRDDVPLYKPSELTSRLGLNEDGTGVTLLLFTGGNAYELEWPLYDMRDERAAHAPAAWTLGLASAAGRAADPFSALADPPPSEGEKKVSQALRAAEVEGANATEVHEVLAEHGSHSSLAQVERGSTMAALQGVFHGAVELKRPTGSDHRAESAPDVLGEKRDGATRARHRSKHGMDHGSNDVSTAAILRIADSRDGLRRFGDPLIDAMAELAAVSLARGPVGVATGASSEIDSASAPPEGLAKRKPRDKAWRGRDASGSAPIP